MGIAGGAAVKMGEVSEPRKAQGFAFLSMSSEEVNKSRRALVLTSQLPHHFLDQIPTLVTGDNGRPECHMRTLKYFQSRKAGKSQLLDAD